MKKAIYTLLFPLAAYLLLLTQADYLHAVAENDLFISGQAFFEETIRTQGGLWTWLGCYFTQFFTYPWLGAMIIGNLCLHGYLPLPYWFRLSISATGCTTSRCRAIGSHRVSVSSQQSSSHGLLYGLSGLS